MFKKTLVYHLYVNNTYKNDIIYKIHKECLKAFAYIFDEIKVTVALDDVSDMEAFTWAVQWVNSFSYGKPVEITLEKNTINREADTFYKKVLKNENDEMVFFFHSKGVSNWPDENVSNDSIFMWVCGIYYYSLSPIIDTYDNIKNSYKTFCGPFLISPQNEEEESIFKPFYAGTGFWVNLKNFRNLVKNGIIKDLECSGRFFAEKYPGMVLRSNSEYGLEATNKIMFNFSYSDGTLFYRGNVNDWDYIMNLYSYPEEFIDFVNYIGNKVGFIPFSE